MSVLGSPCTAAMRGAAAGHPGVLPSPRHGCSRGSARFCSFSASPWHLPQHPEPNTTPRAHLFPCQRRLLLSASSSRQKAALLPHGSSWGPPTPALLPPAHLQTPPRPPSPGWCTSGAGTASAQLRPGVLPSVAFPLCRGSCFLGRLGHGHRSRGWWLLKALLAPAWPHQAGAAVLEQGSGSHRGRQDQPPPPLPADSFAPRPCEVPVPSAPASAAWLGTVGPFTGSCRVARSSAWSVRGFPVRCPY